MAFDTIALIGFDPDPTLLIPALFWAASLQQLPLLTAGQSASFQSANFLHRARRQHINHSVLRARLRQP